MPWPPPQPGVCLAFSRKLKLSSFSGGFSGALSKSIKIRLQPSKLQRKQTHPFPLLSRNHHTLTLWLTATHTPPLSSSLLFKSLARRRQQLLHSATPADWTRWRAAAAPKRRRGRGCNAKKKIKYTYIRRRALGSHARSTRSDCCILKSARGPSSYWALGGVCAALRRQPISSGRPHHSAQPCMRWSLCNTNGLKTLRMTAAERKHDSV